MCTRPRVHCGSCFGRSTTTLVRTRKRATLLWLGARSTMREPRKPSFASDSTTSFVGCRIFALRLGEVSKDTDRSWILRPEPQKRLLSGEIEVAGLVDADFVPALRQKGVDMRIGLDIASIALKRQADTIVLVAGDADFVPAAKLARRERASSSFSTLCGGRYLRTCQSTSMGAVADSIGPRHADREGSRGCSGGMRRLVFAPVTRSREPLVGPQRLQGRSWRSRELCAGDGGSVQVAHQMRQD